jgi:hypothetical protein
LDDIKLSTRYAEAAKCLGAVLRRDSVELLAEWFLHTAVRCSQKNVFRITDEQSSRLSLPTDRFLSGIPDHLYGALIPGFSTFSIDAYVAVDSKYASKSISLSVIQSHKETKRLLRPQRRGAFRFLGAFFFRVSLFSEVIRSPTTCGEFREVPQAYPRGIAAA